MTGNGGGHVLGFDLLPFKDAGDCCGNERRIHDRAIDDGILRQRLQAVAHKLITLFRALQLHSLDGTGTNVETNQRFLFSAPEHFWPLSAPQSARLPLLPRLPRSEEHTSELQSRLHLVCRLLLEKKKNKKKRSDSIYINVCYDDG